jgi:hypothetical protein
VFASNQGLGLVGRRGDCEVLDRLLGVNRGDVVRDGGEGGGGG